MTHSTLPEAEDERGSQDAFAQRFTTKYLRVRGLQTAWLEGGAEGSEAAIAVFWHGFPDGPEVWRAQCLALADEYKVIAPFVRGLGESEVAKSLDRYSPAASALDIMEILQTIDPSASRRVYCVGHDLGSVHAWELAKHLRDRVDGVVIINGLTIRQMTRRFFHSPKQVMKSWYMLFMQFPILPEQLAGASGRFGFNLPYKIRSQAFRLGGRRAEDAVDALESRAALRYPFKQYRAFFRDIPRAWTQKAPRLSCPLLVLWGARDAFLEPPTQDEFELEATQVTIRILDGNHWLQCEKAGEVNRLLLKFFSQSQTSLALDPNRGSQHATDA